MSRKVAWITAGVAGLTLAAATAAYSTGGAAAAVQPAAGPKWHIVKAVKTDFTGDFLAVVATGKSTGWAFDGQGFSVRPTAWREAAGAWSKTAFPSLTGEDVIAAGASGPSDVWAFTQVDGVSSRVLHWTGGGWTVQHTFPAEIGSADVVGKNNVWVFGLEPAPGQPTLGVWHFNGKSWTRVSKTITGGSALSATDAWGFSGTNVEHFAAGKWTATSVKSLLPARDPHGLNDPAVNGILAMSDTNVWALGSANTQDEGGPLVVLHFNGTKWVKITTGQFGAGPMPEFSADGSGGLWLPMLGPVGGTSFLVHFANGKLTKAVVPVNPATLTVESTSRVPGSTQQVAGGFTHAANNLGSKVVAVIMQYS
jgi:hypothetical protein